jgi:hypothetical protein
VLLDWRRNFECALRKEERKKKKRGGGELGFYYRGEKRSVKRENWVKIG